MVAGFISEWWPTSNRNDGRLRVGIPGRLQLESAAPDFTASTRPGTPALVVLNEDAVPKTYWEPGEPRLRRQVLASDLKGGAEVAGATLSNPEPVLSVRTR